MNNIADFFKGYDRLEDDFYIENKDINRKLMERYELKPSIVIEHKRKI